MGPEPGKPSDIPEGGSLEEKWYTSYVAHAFNAGTQEAKTGGSLGVPGQPGLYSNF